MGDSQFSVAGMVFYAVYLGVLFAGLWRTFEKAGYPGWAAIVPIYNIIVLFKIAGKPWWYLLLFLIPLVNVYVVCAFYRAIARAFGKGVGFTIGMILVSPVFYAILGFGDARYLGPGGRGAAGVGGGESAPGSTSANDAPVPPRSDSKGVVW